MFEIEKIEKEEITRVFLKDSDYFLEIMSSLEGDLWRVWLCNKNHFFKRSIYGDSKHIWSLESMLKNLELDSTQEDIEKAIKSYDRQFFKKED